jgi:hypothetical protein
VGKTAKFVGFSVALTLAFYLLAYFFLPGPSPSSALVVVFAAVALCIVGVVQWLFRKRPRTEQPAQRQPAPAQAAPIQAAEPHAAEPKAAPHAAPSQAPPSSKNAANLLLVASAIPLLAFLFGCSSNAAPYRPPSPPPPPPPQGPSIPPPQSAPRVTGFSLLPSNEHEIAGYGLYSYILLTHQPDDSEKSRYRAFLRAIISLPTAEQLGRYVERSHINITYLLVNSIPHDWDRESGDARVDFLIANYDYARATAIAAALPQQVNSGPRIVSVLTPMVIFAPPRPVLYQDLSRAQPTLMTAYVQQFVNQAAQGRFWEQGTLSQFSLNLRNLLETSAVGLGLAKEAVAGWIKFLQ